MNIEQQEFYMQAILILAALLSFTSFLMLCQRRLLSLILLFAVQGFVIAFTALLAAISFNNLHLFISATLTLLLKVIFIPWMLRGEVIQMNSQLESETLKNKALLMLIGAGLMVFSYYALQPIVQITSPVVLNALAASLSVLLLGMLLTITHRQTVAHVVGFVSIENGLFFAAIVATNGIPIVIELGAAFDLLVAAVLFGIFFLHIRTSTDSLTK